MRLSPYLPAALILNLCCTTLFAQLQVALSQERSVYLIYEPMVFTVSLTNITDEPVLLSSEEGKTWLGFIVFKTDTDKVSQNEDLDVKPATIAPGQTLKLPVNITPCFSIRSTGAYNIQAVASIPGRPSILTGKLYFNVGKGTVIWKKEKYEQGTLRVYSLLRFLENNDSNLYLRVEDPADNVVYTTVRLGKLTAFADPSVEFDKAGNIHIIHTAGAQTYRYTMSDPKGKIIHQEDRMVGTTRPYLVKDASGVVTFTGGVEPAEKKKRPTLSGTQQGLQ